MRTVSSRSVLEVPAACVREAFERARGGGYCPSGWWLGAAFPGWRAGWSGIIMTYMTYGFWGFLIVTLTQVVRRLVHAEKPGAVGSNEMYPAVEILKDRHAEGEISQEEFLRIKDELK